MKSVFQGLEQFLVCSEWCLIEMMIAKGVWVDPAPTNQPPSDYQTVGDPQYGNLLYLLTTPGAVTVTQSWSFKDQLLFDVFLAAAIASLPASNMTTASYDNLIKNDLFASDGSVLGIETFETFDQNWLVALYNAVRTDIEPSANYYNGDLLPVPGGTYAPVVAASRTAGSDVIKVGLISDWGTGQQQAADVMSVLTAGTPDYIVHLGDVYYSGTPQSTSTYMLPGEEQNFLLARWPSGYGGRSFTLNSNHEMYCGAQGLFVDALQANLEASARTTPFTAQNGYSMFALSVGDWTILGLDSAYNGTSLDLFLMGNLGSEENGSATTQIQWIKGLNLDPAKVIVLTHHTGFDFDCSPAKQDGFAAFWGQVNGALGGDPYAWYWGHVHNGIIYTQPVAIASATPFKTETYCRCLGHGALPFGVATGLTVGENNIDWFAQQTASGSDLVFNGCVSLTFALDGGVVTSVTETFLSYDPDAQPPGSLAGPTKTIFGAAGGAAGAAAGVDAKRA